MRILKEFKNELLKRKEIMAVLEADSTPGYDVAIKKLAEKFKVSEDVIVIKALKGKFGTHEFIINAFIYDTPELKNTTEPKKKQKKKQEGANK